MTKLDYHSSMRRIALFALLTVAFAPALQAQMHGPLPSVTSMGPGRTFTGPAPTVNSIAPRGIAGGNQFFTTPNCCINPLFPRNPNPQPGHRPHHRPGFGGPGFGAGAYPVYVTPYYYGDYSQPQAPADDSAEEDQYRGGPTIFDRRGNGQYNYQDRASEDRANRDDSSSAAQPRSDVQAPSEEVSDQPDTVLVFKDGHQLEIKGYAIQGKTLFDLTPGHARKVALSDLNIPATQKQNDDRGVDFQVPAGSSGS